MGQNDALRAIAQRVIEAADNAERAMRQTEFSADLDYEKSVAKCLNTLQVEGRCLALFMLGLCDANESEKAKAVA